MRYKGYKQKSRTEMKSNDINREEDEKEQDRPRWIGRGQRRQGYDREKDRKKGIVYIDWY